MRPADEAWWSRFEALVREGDLRGRRVLDVGCGTGRLAAALVTHANAKVWGVDPAPEMLEVARAQAPGSVGFKLGRAERLPFRESWFERVAMTLVVHLVDRPRAFAEAVRVLQADGRLVLATFAPAHFGASWLNRFFPSLEAIDRARFPSGETLEEELIGVGFDAIRVVSLSHETTIDRATALARLRGRHISTFDLLDEEELVAGTARAEQELPPEIEVRREHLVVVASL